MFEDVFLYDEGDQAIYESSAGVLHDVVILKRLYDGNTPRYQVRSASKPACDGVACQQDWLRPPRFSHSELKRYMKAYSPSGFFGSHDAVGQV